MQLMNIFKNKEEVAFCLNQLGTTISADFYQDRKYIDLEQFLVFSTIYLKDDSRLVRAMEYWIYNYGRYLSPRKILKILKNTEDDQYDSAVLGALLSIADDKFPKNGKFKVISPFCKKSEPRKIAKVLMSRVPRDKRWLSYGIEAPLFTPNDSSNYLKYYSYLETHVPELYFRIQGFPASISDIKSVLIFEPDLSIYKVAKIVFATYKTVYDIFQSYHIRGDFLRR